MGHARIKCHCGNDSHIYTSYNGERGWFECDCGCAWSYEDIGSGTISLVKQHNCRDRSKSLGAFDKTEGVLSWR